METTGTKVATVASGFYDLATPNGRMVTHMLGAAGRNKIGTKAIRQKQQVARRVIDGESIRGITLDLIN